MSTSPLARRLPRELRNNLGKYLGVFFLLALVIALESGFLMAASSISGIVAGMRERYRVEDGRVTLAFEATDAQLDAAAQAAEDSSGSAVRFYKNYSVDAKLEGMGEEGADTATLRTYASREEVDLTSVAAGRRAEDAGEIAVDRVFAANNGIGVGDTLRAGGRDLTVVGIVTLADNVALFASNSDFTVNTLTFGVAEVTPEGFQALLDEGASPTYTYSFCFEDQDLTLAQRTDAEKDMLQALAGQGARVTELLDRDSNQSISYAASDLEGDSAMWATLLYIIVTMMAFIFIVLTSGTIEEESAVIGALLASGYRRRELVLHYLALPAIVGLVAAAAGNALGLTVMTQPMANLYYGSYSLPPYHTTWDWGVFAQTTVAPVAVLVLVTLLGLVRKMGHTPLQFLRHETAKGGVKRGVRLPERLGFVARFRLRVFLRNLGNFATVFVGMAFSSMLMLFALAILPTMTHYAQNLRGDVPANHLYGLKAPLELEGEANDRAAEQVEKYAVYALELDRGGESGMEPVAAYGVEPRSRYWEGLDLAGAGAHEVVVGAGLAQKFGLIEGERFSLYDKYEDRTFELAVAGVWGTRSNMNVYTTIDGLNELLGNDEGYFNGYASDDALDIDADYLASDLTPEAMDAVGEQFVGMMGQMILLLGGLAVIIFFIFMYLLTKAVIDRSARSISYMKVFGYRDAEVSRLYVRSITWVCAISLLVCQPVVIAGLTQVFYAMLYSYTGNIEIYVPPSAVAGTLAVGLLTYAAVALLHLRSIRRVPLSVALKVQE